MGAIVAIFCKFAWRSSTYTGVTVYIICRHCAALKQRRLAYSRSSDILLKALLTYLSQGLNDS